MTETATVAADRLRGVSRIAPRLPLAAQWAGCAIGLSILLISFNVASQQAQGALKYHLFWVGMACALVPAIGVACGSRTTNLHRLFGLVTVGAVLSAPKLLLALGGPLYHDEYPHWREVEAIIESGRIFQPVSIVPIAASFPGLHAPTAAVAMVSGVSPWSAAVVVVTTAHILTLLGVYVAARAVFRSNRIAAIAAVVYALNPSYLYFDAQFSYESLAVCYFVWTIAFVVQIGQKSVWRPAGLAAITCLASVCTHHLTTIFLILVLGIIAVCHTIAGRGEDRSVPVALWTLVGVSAAAFILWVTLAAPNTYTYLSPYFGGSLRQLLSIGGTGSGSRTLYAGTTVPQYEILLAFLTPPLLLILTVLALRNAISRKPHDPTQMAFWVLGVLYFISLPLILTPLGAEGARRSWAFSYLGLSMVLAPWLAGVLTNSTSAKRRPWAQFAMVAAFLVVLIGNTSAGLNSDYRFPGPFRFGSETRGITAETITMARWLKTEAGPGARVVTDRFTGLAVGSYGGAQLAVASKGFPIWQLYTSATQPPAKLVAALKDSHYKYLVIDKRLASKPVLGSSIFGNAEPEWERDPVFTEDSLAKFDKLPWTVKIYESESYSVYRFDFSAWRTASASGAS